MQIRNVRKCQKRRRQKGRRKEKARERVKCNNKCKLSAKKMGRCWEKEPPFKQSQSGFKRFLRHLRRQGKTFFRKREMQEIRPIKKRTCIFSSFLPKKSRQKTCSVVLSFSCFSSLSLPPEVSIPPGRNKGLPFSFWCLLFFIPMIFSLCRGKRERASERERERTQQRNSETALKHLQYYWCMLCSTPWIWKKSHNNKMKNHNVNEDQRCSCEVLFH